MKLKNLTKIKYCFLYCCYSILELELARGIGNRSSYREVLVMGSRYREKMITGPEKWFELRRCSSNKGSRYIDSLLYNQTLDCLT